MHLRTPKLAVARTIERLQYRPGHYALALAVTDEVRRDLIEVHGVPEDQIEMEPYPIDVDELRAAERGHLRSQLEIGDEVPLALFVGHNFERKGLGDAVKTVAALDRAHLAVVGDGDAKPYVKLADDLGISNRVHFVGATENPEAIFCDADVFLLPTYEDVWGIAVIEAMAAGLPVVTTDAAGVANLVSSSGAGFVVPAGSVRSLREAVASLLADTAARHDMARHGQKAAIPYGLEAYGARMLRHYEGTIQRRARSV